MSIAASGDGQSSSEDEDSAELHPSGVVAAAESDPELTAVLSRAAARSGLEACTPPIPEPSRHGPWLATTPCPGSFLPGSARGADEVVDGPFLRPEAARLPPPSSLPSMAGRLGGTLTFPRWRVRLRCTCACKMPPLGGIVLVSRPKPLN